MSCLNSKLHKDSHYSAGITAGLVLIKILAASYARLIKHSLTTVIACVDWDMTALYRSKIKLRAPFCTIIGLNMTSSPRYSNISDVILRASTPACYLNHLRIGPWTIVSSIFVSVSVLALSSSRFWPYSLTNSVISWAYPSTLIFPRDFSTSFSSK